MFVDFFSRFFNTFQISLRFIDKKLKNVVLNHFHPKNNSILNDFCSLILSKLGWIGSRSEI